MACNYICPRCHAGVERKVQAWQCTSCGRAYPIVCGIPDFRLEPDPYISFEDEYRKAERIAQAAGDRSFAELVRYYWQITPDVPPAAVERYVRYALDGIGRGEACLQAMDERLRERWRGDCFLEAGCGTGGMLIPAASRFREIVGTDIALRWLVVAKRRLEEAGIGAQLVCCSADRLPFDDATFDAIAGLHMLEHTGNAEGVFAETARVLRPGGHCVFPTPNRYSLGPEPCVRVWGVGFLPRRFMGAYVRWMKGVPYRNIRLLSSFELERYLRKARFMRYSIEPQRFAECELQAASPALRALVRLYHVALRIPGISRLMRVIGPMHQVTATR